MNQVVVNEIERYRTSLSTQMNLYEQVANGHVVVHESSGQIHFLDPKILDGVACIENSCTLMDVDVGGTCPELDEIKLRYSQHQDFLKLVASGRFVFNLGSDHVHVVDVETRMCLVCEQLHRCEKVF